MVEISCAIDASWYRAALTKSFMSTALHITVVCLRQLCVYDVCSFNGAFGCYKTFVEYSAWYLHRVAPGSCFLTIQTALV